MASASADGSIGNGLKLAGTATPSGLAASITTTPKNVTINEDIFPLDGSKGRPIVMVVRGVGQTLNIRFSSAEAVGQTYPDGTFSPPILLGGLWRDGADWLFTGGGTGAIEYILSYQVNPDAGKR